MRTAAAAVAVARRRVGHDEADALGGLEPKRREKEADAGRRGDADGPAVRSAWPISGSL